MIIALIGNTHSRFARWHNLSVEEPQCCETESLDSRTCPWRELLESSPDVPVVAACVVPAVRERLERMFPDRMTWVDASLDLGVDLSEIDTTTIGADRLANAVAAVHECDLPVLIIDFGTAISSVLIDANRRLRGGFILPGRLLQRQVLAERTGQLPFVELGSLPQSPFAGNTEQAMRAGLDFGALGAVERLIDECTHALSGLRAYAVGGDATFFHAGSNRLSPLDTAFTLRGVGYVSERLRGGSLIIGN